MKLFVAMLIVSACMLISLSRTVWSEPPDLSDDQVDLVACASL